MGLVLLLHTVACATQAMRTSFIDCIQPEIDTVAEASHACYFEDVCIDIKARQIQIFVDPSEPVPSAPVDAIDIRTRGLGSFILTTALRIGPAPQIVPESAEGVPVLIHPYWPENFGHAIGDDLFPAWRVAQVFGIAEIELVVFGVSMDVHPSHTT